MSGAAEKPVKAPADASGRGRAQRPEGGAEAPLVRTDRLDHVHLYVQEVPVSVAWYRRVLGLVPYGEWDPDEARPPHPTFLAPSTGGHHCVSLFVGDRPRGGDRTVAFHAGERGFLGFARALPAEGVPAHDGRPLTLADHNDYGMAITFNFLDPDGNHLELVTYDHRPVRAALAGMMR